MMPPPRNLARAVCAASTRSATLICAFLCVLVAYAPAAVAQGLPGADELDSAPLEEPAAPEAPAEPATEEEEDEQEADAEAQPAAEADQPAATTEPAGPTAAAGGEPAGGGQAGVAAEMTIEEEADEPVDERLVEAGMNFEGAVGFPSMTSAKPGQANTYRVGFLGTFTSGSDVIRYNDENDYVAGRLLLQATFLEHLSANLGLGASNNVNSFGRPQSMLSQGDLLAGVRGHWEATPGLWVGGGLTGYVPTGFESAGLDFSGTSVRPQLLATAEFGELLSQPLPLSAHFNVGYRIDNTDALVDDDIDLTRVERFAHGISNYDYVELGLGVEYSLPYVSPFLAWNLDIPVNSDVPCTPDEALGCVDEIGFASYPDVLSLGARAEPVERLGLIAAIDFGLTSDDAFGVPVTPPWAVTLGASWTIDPEPKVEIQEKVVEKEKIIEKMPPRGYVLGTIIDAKTLEPIADARVYYTNLDKTPQLTVDQGTFRSYDLPPGTKLSFRVDHPDYEQATIEVTIPTPKANGQTPAATGGADEAAEAAGDTGAGATETAADETAAAETAAAETAPGELGAPVANAAEEPEELVETFELKLKPLPKQGTLIGVVIDQEGEPIPNAQVTITGPETVEATTGPQGRFETRATVGPYTVAATAEGYLTGGRDVELAKNKELQVDITLKPEPDEKLVEVEEDRIRINDRIYFETGSDKIQPRSFNVLNQVAAVLLENPRIQRIRIEGHTDDVGAEDYNLELSQKRAESVRSYLIEQGIAPGRLSAQGFGESQPLVPNVSQRNRGLNRRVEFKILEQGQAAPAADPTEAGAEIPE